MWNLPGPGIEPIYPLFVTLQTVACQFLCPGDSSGKNTRVGCHALLQGISLTWGSNPCLLSPALAGGFFTTSATWEAPQMQSIVLNTFFFPIQTLTQEVEVLVYPTLFFFQYDLHSKLAHAGPLSAPNLNTKFKKAAKLHV